MNNDAILGIVFLAFCGGGVLLCLWLLSASLNAFTRATARIWYEEQQRLGHAARRIARGR